MRREIFAAAALLLPLFAGADDQDLHDHHHPAGTEVASPGDAPIKIMINPEARVGAVLGGALPQPVPCGSASDLSMKIVNQGFVTARLEAHLVGDVPPGVTLDFHPEPLTGRLEELRELHITLTKPGPTDLTIAFRARNEIPDLGGRDRVHFLMHCLQVGAH